MFKKFKDGVAFGAGFALVYFLFSWIYSQAYMLMFEPSWESSGMYLDTPSEDAKERELPAAVKAQIDERIKVFFDLPLEEQLEVASFIAIARFHEQEDGRQAAIISEILKTSGKWQERFEVGDEWRDASYFPGGGRHEWNAEAVLIMRAPGGKGTTLGFDGERLQGLGGISIDDIREMIPAETEE